MRLKKAENEIRVRGTASVSIYKSGVFQFSLAAQKELPLEGKYARFYHDLDNIGDWYLYIADNDGLRIKQYSDNQGPNCCSKTIAFDIKKATKNPQHKTLRALIGSAIKENGMILYPLLIKNGDERP